jgi:hypothetical protein
VWNDAVLESKRLMHKYSVDNVYGYKHYEGKGSATYRGKTINNSFNFNRYGQFQKEIGASLTLLFDPLLPLQTPVLQYGSILFNHCNDGSFYGDASNISTMASRILNLLKQRSSPYFLLAGYQRFRQDDFGIRSDPSTSDISIPRLEQVVSLMSYDTTVGKKIRVVTVEEFAALLRKHHSITAAEDRVSPPALFSLEQNFPNPFNPSTLIRLHLTKSVRAILKVHDLLGRVVEVLYDGNPGIGTHTFRFAPGEAGLPSGVYFYTVTAGEYGATRKMLFIR